MAHSMFMEVPRDKRRRLKLDDLIPWGKPLVKKLTDADVLKAFKR